MDPGAIGMLAALGGLVGLLLGLDFAWVVKRAAVVIGVCGRCGRRDLAEMGRRRVDMSWVMSRRACVA